MSTPVHERLLKDLDQLRHVHGLPPSQVAAKTAKYLSDLRATGEAEGLQEQALQCRAQQIMEYLCLVSCVDLLRKQAPSTAALVQNLLQQSYASNKGLWNQLTTSGQAQVQLCRDMQHQKTIAHVMQGEVNDLQHKLDRLMQHLSSTIPSTLLSLPSRTALPPAATASSSRSSSSSSGMAGSPRLQQHRSWTSTAGPSRESSLNALPSAPAPTTAQPPAATAAAAVAAAVAAAGARARPYAELPTGAPSSRPNSQPPAPQLAQERAGDAPQPDAPQQRAADASSKEASLGARPTAGAAAPSQAAPAQGAGAAAAGGSTVGLSAVRAALRVQPPPVVRPGPAVTSPVGSARQATRWLRAVASNTRPLAPVLEVPAPVVAPGPPHPAAAMPAAPGGPGSVHVASYAVAVSVPPSAEPSAEEVVDLAGGLLGGLPPTEEGRQPQGDSRPASRAGSNAKGAAASEAAAPKQQQHQGTGQEEGAGGCSAVTTGDAGGGGVPHRDQQVAASTTGPQSWPMTFDSSSAGSTPVAEPSETPRFEVAAEEGLQPRAGLQQQQVVVVGSMEALQEQAAAAVSQGAAQQSQGGATGNSRGDGGQQQQQQQQAAAVHQSPSDSSGVMFASPDTAATRGGQQQADITPRLAQPAQDAPATQQQQQPPAAALHASAAPPAAAAAAAVAGAGPARAGSSASSVSHSSSYSRLPGPPSRPSSTCSAAAGGSVASTGRSSALGLARPPPLTVVTSPGRSTSGPLTSGRNLWHRRSRAAAVAPRAPELQVEGDDSALSQQGASRGPPSQADDVQMASPGADAAGSSWGMAVDSSGGGGAAGRVGLRGRGSGSSSSMAAHRADPLGEGPPNHGLRASGAGRASVTRSSGGSSAVGQPSRLSSPEKVGLVEAGGGCADLTLVELRAIVADVWNNKQLEDARVDEAHQPRQTLAAYLGTYLSDKTPTTAAAQQAGAMVRQGLLRWAEEVPEVRLFAKVLEHQVNEQYQADFTARKQQLRRLLEPLAGPRPSSSRSSKEGGQGAGQQGGRAQQLDLGSAEVRAVLRQWVGQRGSLIALLEGLRRRFGTGPLGAEQVVQGALLWDLTQQEARLHTVRTAFTAVDTARTGVLDKAQFVAFCNRFCHEVAQEEAEQLYCTELDPWGHQRVTFSAIAYCLLQVASDEGPAE